MNTELSTVNMDLSTATMLSFWATKSFVHAALLHAALRLHLFETLPIEGQGTLTVVQLAQRLHTSKRGTRVLCEPLVSSGLLAKDEEGGLSLRIPFASQLHDPTFLAYLRDEAAWWHPSAKLAEAVRTNAPIVYNGESWDLLAHYRTTIPTLRRIESTITTSLIEQVKHFFLSTQALIAAAALDLFVHLSDVPLPSQVLAHALHLPETGLAVLLDALTNMTVLVHTNAGYAYPTLGQANFTSRKLAAYSQLLHITALQWEAFGNLSQAVTYDHCVLDLHDAVLGGQFYASLAHYSTSIFPSYFRIARDVPQALRAVHAEGSLAVLDVGAGSGVWGAAFAYSDQQSDVTFLDLESVLPQARHNVERLGCLSRAHFTTGDLLQTDFGLETYDIIVLGQVCHTQLPAALPGFLRRLRCALRPGGYLVIADMVLDARRDGPLNYLYFNVKEFISTGGEVLSLSEYSCLLTDAGLSSHRVYALAGIDVIIATHDDAPLPQCIAHATQRVIKMDSPVARSVV